MPIPKAVARINRYFANPITRSFAGWMPGFGILEHRGRRSGQVYRIPLNIFPAAGGFVIALTYGADVDWVKNVLADRGCRVRYRRQEIRLVHPVFIPEEEGMARMPPLVRVLLRLMKVSEFLRLEVG